MRTSETQALAYVARHQSAYAELHEDDIYKAAILSANSGLVFDKENALSTEMRLLLEVRRSMSRKDEPSVENLMKELSWRPLSGLCAGDLKFLKGVWAYRSGDAQVAQQHLLASAQEFEKIDESHRSLRALINAQICDRNSQSYVSGALYGLEREVKREGFFDLLGNIKKARAIELCQEAKFSEAKIEIIDAIEAYSMDGCAEDLAVSWALRASLEWIAGDSRTAQDCMARLRLIDGKVSDYITIFQSLVAGRKPALPASHPLAKTPWPILCRKTGSVSSQIQQLLQEGRKTRDELIENIWPDETWSPALVARLHTAVNFLRKKKNLPIGFDGKSYFKE